MSTREFEEHKKEVIANASWLRNWCLDFVEKHKEFVYGYYEEGSGEPVPVFTGETQEDIEQTIHAFNLETYGRYTFSFKDPAYKQSKFNSRNDGTASGKTIELKLCFYPFEDKIFKYNLIDVSKINELPDDGYVIYIYVDVKNKQVLFRIYVVADIKKYGVIKYKGGQTSNYTKKGSKKPEYWIEHKYCERVEKWKKNEKKS